MQGIEKEVVKAFPCTVFFPLECVCIPPISVPAVSVIRTPPAVSEACQVC